MQKMGFSKSAVTFCLFILVLFFFQSDSSTLKIRRRKGWMCDFWFRQTDYD